MAKDIKEQGEVRKRHGIKTNAHLALAMMLLVSSSLFATAPGDAISAQDWLDSSKTFYNAKDLDNALYCAEKAIEIDPTFANAWLFKGISLNKKGKIRASIASFDRALQINPNYIEAWNSKSMALENLSRYEEAVDCHDMIIQKEENSDCSDSFRTAMINKARVLRKLYRYNESIKCYDRLSRCNETLALSEKGITLSYLGEYDKAIQCFNETITSTKAYQDEDCIFRAEINKGIAFIFLKNPSSALACFDEAINSGKSYDRIWTAWFCKGVALENLNRRDEASSAFREAARLRVKGTYEKSLLHRVQNRMTGFLDLFGRVIS